MNSLTHWHEKNNHFLNKTKKEERKEKSQVRIPDREKAAEELSHFEKHTDTKLVLRWFIILRSVPECTQMYTNVHKPQGMFDCSFQTVNNTALGELMN